MTRFYDCQTFESLLNYRVLSEERMGLSFTINAGPGQPSHFRARVPPVSWPCSVLSDWRLLQPGGPYPRINIPHELDDSVIPPGIGVGESSVELSLSYGRRSVDQFVLVSGSPLGPMTKFYPYPFFIDNCVVVLPVGRSIWRKDKSVTYSAIADWSGHLGPITIYYRLIWDCVPSSSPLTTCRNYGGGIITRFLTGLEMGGLTWRYFIATALTA
jgi:hypothetical protein